MPTPDRSALPRDSAGWAHWLMGQQLPALSRTARAIAECAADDSRSSTDLAALILRDAGMTTKVLRLASSRLYNPHGARIRTVSRAVALLGFGVVSEIALGIAVLDTFAGRAVAGAQAATEAAHALRVAVQSRGLAEQAALADAEEVFIAGLLQGIGRLAFWSASPAVMPDWAGNAAESSALARDRVRSALDLDLDDLSVLLNAELRLSPLLLAEDDPPGRAAARFGQRWVEALSAGGDAGDFERALDEAAERFGQPVDALREAVAARARQADALIDQLFDPAVRALLPATRPVVARVEPGESRPLRADPMLALEVLRDLGELLATGRPDPGVALSMAMEGMQRAAGFDRVAFVLLGPDRRDLRLRSVLATAREPLAAAFPLPLADCGRLPELLATARPVRLGGEGTPDTGRLLARLGARTALLAPLAVDGRAIGLLYADRAESGEAIDLDAQTMFGLLAQQANLALGMTR